MATLKKFLPLMAAFLLLACACPLTRQAPLSSPMALPSPTRAPVVPGSLTTVRLQPADGALTSQLRQLAPEAAALGQHMFVEFDANW